jgi:SAM-dependent methyltransferase
MSSYRNAFDTPEKALCYETVQYSETAYGSILQYIEQTILLSELNKVRSTKRRIDYLDFACGTGRIISNLERHVDSATGVDISESMLAIASGKTASARIMCADITQSPEVEGSYDFITAMRFFLNAEQPLRIAALSALRARLRDRESRLVINNHGNPYSHKVILWPLHKLREWTQAAPPRHYLTLRDVRRLADQAGLEIVGFHGYGQLSGKAAKLMPQHLVESLERRLADFPILRRIGSHQMYVLRLRGH